MTVKTCTKVNIGLHVLRRRADGYHDLETLFVPYYGFGDLLTVEPAAATTIEIIRQEGVDWDPQQDLTIRAWRLLKADFPALNYGKGYDNCFVVDDWKKGVVRPVAELSETTSGRRLLVSTDAPGIQVYTGNWLAGCPVSKSGRAYQDYDGVALECQFFPDSPNQPQFPFETLKPGEVYENTIVFAFA